MVKLYRFKAGTLYVHDEGHELWRLEIAQGLERISNRSISAFLNFNNLSHTAVLKINTQKSRWDQSFMTEKVSIKKCDDKVGNSRESMSRLSASHWLKFQEDDSWTKILSYFLNF